MEPPKRCVAVVGKGRNCPPEVFELALEVGRAVGSIGQAAVLITGGLGGAMDAAAQGCREAGGTVVGLLPAAGSASTEPSRHLDLAIKTGLSVHVRNVVVASAADLLIAVPGSHGAMQETVVAVDRGIPVWAVGEHEWRLPEVRYLDGVESLRSALLEWAGDAPPGGPGSR